MSRFSLAEAKGLGWVVTHADESGQGSSEKYAAEKYFDGTPCREYGPSMGLLLERVFAYEANRAARGYVNPTPPAPVVPPVVVVPPAPDASEEVSKRRRHRHKHGDSAVSTPHSA